MERKNNSIITEFIFEGLSKNPKVQCLLFVLFLSIYIITVNGNLVIILAIRFSRNLHTPMYVLLVVFSFLDLFYMSSTVPKMLSSLLAEQKTIYFYECGTQMFCVLLFGGTECYLLVAMAYDRYNAICHPLLYPVIMNKITCIKLIAGSWLIGTVNATIHTALTFTLPFCNANKINQFFCDIPPLLKLACTDTWINEIVIFGIGGCVIIGSLLLIMISYTQIISTILNILSSSGRMKAFSTCASHFTVVVIYYGSGIFMYMRPKSFYMMEEDKMISVMYAVIAPFLNPFIYTLRNNDMKTAIIKLINQLTVIKKY
ncbi:olfactory receptor 5AP2-like [Discoglossus pictus]